MNFEPTIRVNLSKFKSYYELESRTDGDVFERYANQVILSSHQPGAFSVDDMLLDIVCVGGPNDMGIDGICIKLNGTLISSVLEAEDILNTNKQAVSIEFIFIQSKYKNKFDTKEFRAFTSGTKDFLSEQHYEPMNDKIKEWLKIKDYLLSPDIIDRWYQSPPSVRLYYVVMGEWNSSSHITAAYSQFEADIKNLNTYSSVSIQYVDTAAFIQTINNNDNYFTCTMQIFDSFALPEVNNVDNSLMVMVSADNLTEMLDTGEGIIRKALFNDNVRDFQGNTTINEEVMSTIIHDPKSFILMNNGITIICDSMISANRKLKITNPQIVNGCQTCNLLYSAKKQGHDCSGVTILAKIIASNTNEDITNRIVKSTNRQNIVYDEAFEVTREFHKNLEAFFNAFSQENKFPLYYERRSRQYHDIRSITVSQKVNFTIVIQSFISVFLNQPFSGHRHPSVLLQQYKDKIFVDKQSKFPYLISSLIYLRIENTFKKNKNKKENDYRAYKAHIALIFKFITCGQSPDINDEKEIDLYCAKIQKIILSEESFNNYYTKSLQLFVELTQKWVKEKGDHYRFAIKDNENFTKFLVEEILKPDKNIKRENIKYRGTVIKIGLDRFGKGFGFISKSPFNIFFHSSDNSNIDIVEVYGKTVLYDTVTDHINKKTKAINIELVN